MALGLQPAAREADGINAAQLVPLLPLGPCWWPGGGGLGGAGPWAWIANPTVAPPATPLPAVICPAREAPCRPIHQVGGPGQPLPPAPMCPQGPALSCPHCAPVLGPGLCSMPSLSEHPASLCICLEMGLPRGCPLHPQHGQLLSPFGTQSCAEYSSLPPASTLPVPMDPASQEAKAKNAEGPLGCVTASGPVPGVTRRHVRGLAGSQDVSCQLPCGCEGRKSVEQAPSWEPRGRLTVSAQPTLHQQTSPVHASACPSVHCAGRDAGGWARRSLSTNPL